MKKHLISIIFLALLPLVANADNVELGGIMYNLNSNTKTAEVTHKSKKYTGDIVIPEIVIYNDVEYSVTSIGLVAFQKCSSLTSVVIPNSVTSIRSSAFYECSGLTSVLIPNSVTTIEDCAFAGCSGLSSIPIGNTVTTIGDHAFSGCSGLSSVTIGNSVTAIGDYAFSGCSGLSSVNIGNSVTTIGDYAFSECNALTNITIPNSVTAIGDYPFSGCIKMKNIIFGLSLTSIGNRAFSQCNALSNVIIPNSVISIGEYAFSGCSALASVFLGSSVASIGEAAFMHCGLTKVAIPSSVIRIGERAFAGCIYLKSIEVDKGNPVYDSRDNCNAIITTADNKLIAGCESTIIPNSVTIIGGSAFYYLFLPNIKIPSSVTNVEDNAFWSLTTSSLRNVYCHSDNPPNTDEDTFNNYDVKNATLHVPESTIEDYRATSPWNGFKAIVALPKYNLTFIVDGETYKTYSYEDGKLVPAEVAPEKEGYTFTGWSEIPGYMPAHDVEVTGSFTINQYKLTYMVDGVEYKMADVEYGATIVPEEAPKKEGSAFSEWSGLPKTMPAHDLTVNATYYQYKGKCLTPTIVYKDGKFKFESEEDVEFVWNINVVGNSGKDSEVGTPKKYILRVCATKEFYEDSDPVTMEMGMSSPIGDVNGDGVINAADIAALVDIILHM